MKIALQSASGKSILGLDKLCQHTGFLRIMGTLNHRELCENNRLAYYYLKKINKVLINRTTIFVVLSCC